MLEKQETARAMVLGHLPTDSYVLGALIGFTTGLAVTLVLLALTLRAARLPGTPLANVCFALAALVWNVGGLAHTLALAGGAGPDDRALLIASVVQFTAAAAWPIPILAIWKPFAVDRWQRVGFRVLQVLAPVVASLTAIVLWGQALSGFTIVSFEAVKQFTAISGSLLAVAAVVVLGAPHTSRAAWFSAVTILVGVSVATASLVVRGALDLSANADTAILVASKQSPLLIVLGAFFVFARFRFADVFIRQTLRILLTSILATALVVGLGTDILARLAALSAFPKAVQIFAGGVLASALLFLFLRLDQTLVRAVDRWIVRVPDYSRATRELAANLRELHAASDVGSVARQVARTVPDIEQVEWIPAARLPGSLWPAEVRAGEPLELETGHPLRQILGVPGPDLLVPVRSGDDVVGMLTVMLGHARRGLVTHELQYLEAVATQIGHRLDALNLERRMVEQQHREVVLQQQLTDAELRALRAQVNPHFLFNALNTIADLIVTDPTAAEAMTLRLAKVFRHVLAHSGKPVTSIGEEIEFLRAYLQIEEARFGDRLQVCIDVPPDVARDHIPSLILQPLVENALKHGIGPKPGAGHLWVSARTVGEYVCLNVEDDGIGLSAGPGHGARASTSVGLTNVAQRLAVVYRHRASVRLEPRDQGGTRVTIVVPRVH